MEHSSLAVQSPLLEKSKRNLGSAPTKSKKIYVHVRHFTTAFNKRPARLACLIWFENGTCFGPVTLSNHVKSDKIKKPIFKYHLYGEVQLEYPFPAPVAYVQLRKMVGKVSSAIGLDTDIFIQDCYLKLNSEFAPDEEILAYFRFTGFIVNRANILMRNLMEDPHQKKLNASEVKQNARNRTRFVQDRLMPGLEWATLEDSEKPFSKTRAVINSISTQKNAFDFFVDTITFKMQPLYYNIVTSYLLDVKRFKGTPGFARLPPHDFTFSSTKFTEFIWSREEPVVYARLTALKGLKRHSAAMIDFTPYLMKCKPEDTSPREIEDVKRVVKCFEMDEEFGRQYVESLFCTHLHVVQDDSKIDPAWVAELISDAGRNAKSEGKRLFYVDYSGLIGIPRNELVGYFSPARVLMEYDDSTKLLKPIGISLYYPEENMWKTHLPSHGSWQVAKMFAKCAGSQEHQIVSHALYTHLVVEPFAIALERKVPLDHILYRILKTHFRYTLDVNFKARTALLNFGGLFDQFIGTGGIHAGHIQFMGKMYKEWTFDKMCLPQELKERGFVKDPNNDDECELPNYYYAKDAMTLWAAFEKYMRGVVLAHYASEEEFQADEILKNYFAEVKDEGFPTAPTFSPTSRKELIRILTAVVYTASVQHSAVNFPQFSHYGFVANSPLVVVKPAPNPDEKVEIFDYLPGTQAAVLAIQTVWGLSRFVLDDERFLFEEKKHFFNLSLWNDPKFTSVCAELHNDFAIIESRILSRGPTPYGTRYDWLLPSRLPTSIAS